MGFRPKIFGLGLMVPFLVSGAIASSECKNVDLRSKSVLGSVRNQGKLGWCFAFTAADMYSVALNKRLSPFDLAVNYYRYLLGQGIKKGGLKITQWSGGRQDWVMDSAKLYGVCEDKYFSAYQTENSSILLKLDELATTAEDMSGEDRREYITKKIYSIYPEIYRVFPMTPSPKLRDAFVNAQYSEFPLAGVADQICADKRVDVSRLRRSTIANQIKGKDWNLDFLNENLQLGRVVGIGYNAAVLSDKTKTEGMNHISSIVGSRKINGKCEYLLRNSWGKPNIIKHDKSLLNKLDGEFVWLPAEFVRDMAQEMTAVYQGK